MWSALQRARKIRAAQKQAQTEGAPSKSVAATSIVGETSIAAHRLGDGVDADAMTELWQQGDEARAKVRFISLLFYECLLHACD